MAQTSYSRGNSGRAYALARRKALSGGGQAALTSASAASKSVSQPASAPAPAMATGSAATGVGGRAASVARRRAMSTTGKSGISSSDRTRTEVEQAVIKPKVPNPIVTKTPQPAASARINTKPRVAVRNDSSCKALTKARRSAMAAKGKAGINEVNMTQPQTTASTVKAPEVSGREVAKASRDNKSRGGNGASNAAQKRPMRPPRTTGAAADAPWKVGAGDTSRGQRVTGTMVSRSESVTGNEASTCRDITGTEYMSADIFKAYCKEDMPETVTRSGVTTTGLGNAVSGNNVGRSSKVTGNESGSCISITGADYVDRAQIEKYCSKRSGKTTPLMKRPANHNMQITGDNAGHSDKVTGDDLGRNQKPTGTRYTKTTDIGGLAAPMKVGTSETLRGSGITGTVMGRRDKMTGNESGTCKNVTGDDYLGKEQYERHCDAAPVRTDQKSGVTSTSRGNTVTGTMTGRADRVTGDELGACKAVTGLSFVGLDQSKAFCQDSETQELKDRTRPIRGTAGARLTGQQPSVGGRVTGDGKGACGQLTGTAYIGSDQYAEACPNGSIGEDTELPETMNQFSISLPAGGAAKAKETAGQNLSAASAITGSFGKADGKVTGTDDARFGEAPKTESIRPMRAVEVEGRVKSRVTGEGQDTGLKITGDDWDRNEHVTGTEGRSATKRNPSIRTGGMNATMQVEQKRNQKIPLPNSKVTGGSGNTEKGSLITYSGGARG